MELGIQNFAKGGNHLGWINAFESKVVNECLSKTMDRAKQGVYYQRMISSLGDTRSIDTLVPKSMRGHRKTFNYNPKDQKVKAAISHILERNKITSDLFASYVRQNIRELSAENIRRSDATGMTDKMKSLLKRKSFSGKDTSKDPEIFDMMAKHTLETFKKILAEIEEKIKKIVGDDESIFYIKHMNNYITQTGEYIAMDGGAVLITPEPDGTHASGNHTYIDLPTMSSRSYEKGISFDVDDYRMPVPRSRGKSGIKKLPTPYPRNPEVLPAEVTDRLSFDLSLKPPPTPQTTFDRVGLPSTNPIAEQEDRIHRAISASSLNPIDSEYFHSMVNSPGDGLENAISRAYLQGDMSYDDTSNIYEAMGIPNEFSPEN